MSFRARSRLPAVALFYADSSTVPHCAPGANSSDRSINFSMSDILKSSRRPILMAGRDILSLYSDLYKQAMGKRVRAATSGMSSSCDRASKLIGVLCRVIGETSKRRPKKSGSSRGSIPLRSRQAQRSYYYSDPRHPNAQRRMVEAE